MAAAQQIQTDAHGDGAVKEGLKEFGADPKVRTLVEGLERGLVGSPLMSTDLDLFKYNIGMTSKAELLAKAKGHILPVLEKSQGGEREGICTLAEKLKDADAKLLVSADEINLKQTVTPLGTRSSCASVPRIRA